MFARFKSPSIAFRIAQTRRPDMQHMFQCRNLLAGQHDTQKQRPPPAKPTPIKFPVLQPPEPSNSKPPDSWTQPGVSISRHFLRLKKPSDVTKDTLALLNVTFQPECDLDTLFLSFSNSKDAFLPPKSWLESPETVPSLPESAATLLSNGRKLPDQKEFHARAKELLFKNADAFSSLTRKRCTGQTPLRLAHFRKFWEGLDNLAYYWDTSLDEYLPPVLGAANERGETFSRPLSDSTNKEGQEAERATGDEPRKKAKTAETANEEPLLQPQNIDHLSNASLNADKLPPVQTRVIPARAAPPKTPWVANMESQGKPLDLSNGSYRGYRIGNGAEMPDQYRIDCVRAFVEPIAWAFGATLSAHRRPPVLTIEHVRFPVRMSSVAWRQPQDRTKARQGYMEGPVLGVQCRADVNFGAMGRLDPQSTLDAVREMGGLLLLAQERAREGKMERRGGEGKWWTTKERWGGGPGGEAGEATEATEVLAKEGASKLEEKPVERNRDGSKSRRRPTPAENWKTLRPGNPLWDPKITFEAVGKDRSVAWDNVFMVSSLNHHISLLKLCIHPAYLEYITEGKLPKDPPSEPDWCSPKLSRTRWFDLFNVDDRAEAMRGLWGIMSYLMRADDNGYEDTTMNQ
ncbi:system b [Pyrenophora seminiperda CCB06]|uniref:System b n=1 Tax=Pyrenophora seminiperda CCB06 TaxID=1302712 RepID=A0A3M7M4V8_9PLEO|nr:system b [Pyrenophora seminiperda CCB06]